MMPGIKQQVWVSVLYAWIPPGRPWISGLQPPTSVPLCWESWTPPIKVSGCSFALAHPSPACRRVSDCVWLTPPPSRHGVGQPYFQMSAPFFQPSLPSFPIKVSLAAAACQLFQCKLERKATVCGMCVEHTSPWGLPCPWLPFATECVCRGKSFQETR